MSEISSRRMILTVDRDDLALVLEALRADSNRRQRAATRAAGELDRERKLGEVKDPRPASQAIARALAAANAVDSFADLLEQAWETPETPPVLVDLPKPTKRTRKRATPAREVNRAPVLIPSKSKQDRSTEEAYAEGLAAANQALEIEFGSNPEDDPTDEVVEILTEE